MRFPWTLQVWHELLTMKTAVVVFDEAFPGCVEHAHLCTREITAVIGMHKLAMYIIMYVTCR